MHVGPSYHTLLCATEDFNVQKRSFFWPRVDIILLQVNKTLAFLIFHSGYCICKYLMKSLCSKYSNKKVNKLQDGG